MDGKAMGKSARRSSPDTVSAGQKADSTNDDKPWTEELIYGFTFLSIALVFSTGLEVKFTLPKMAALQLATILLISLWTYRLSKNKVATIPPLILYTGIALGLWWIFSSLFALHKPTYLYGYYGRYNGLWTHLIYLALFFVTATLRWMPAGSKE